MVQFGKIGNSNLDYQNANSPDPTYFKKLPSYYSSMYGKDEGNIRVLLRRIMPKRVAFSFSKLKLIGIPVSGQPKSGNRFQWKYHGL
jgi:hypothetical protein